MYDLEGAHVGEPWCPCGGQRTLSHGKHLFPLGRFAGLSFLIFFLFKFLRVHLFCGSSGHTHATECMWRSENTLCVRYLSLL